MANTYLSRTFGSAGNRQSWTWSAWIKKTKVYNSTSSSDRAVWFGGYSGNNDTDWLEFGTQGDVFYFTTNAISNSGNRYMRDPNAWFHAHVTYDGSNLKFYHNNELDFNNTQLSGNRGINQASVHTIGCMPKNAGTLRFFEGLMSHIHFVDGSVLAPSVFGETDSTTGEWKIKADPSYTVGTNGFFILKDGNSVTDSSSNSNAFTVGGGTLTNTNDCPDNVFCTANTLDRNSLTRSVGNTKLNWSQSAGNFAFMTGTLGITTGKFYWEAKITSADDSTGIGLGVVQTEPYLSRTTTTGVDTSLFYGLGARFTTAKAITKTSNGVDSSISDTWSNDVIIRIAYDGDAGKIYMWKGTSEFNGQTFSSNTSFNDATLTAGTMVTPYFTFGDGGSGTKTSQVELNFGNGYFGTTAISSAGSNASGFGTFEYDVPSGYTALCTKGLNT